MAGNGVGFKKLPGRVASSFRLGTRLASTYSADAYAIQGRVAQAGNVLWKTRGSVTPRYAEKFLARLELLSGHRSVVPIIQYGLDADNIGYAVINADGLVPLSAGDQDTDRLFAQALVVLEGLHAQNLTCGDIGENSFAVDRNGKVVLFAPLGDPECEQDGDESLRSQHIRFRLPNQKSGEVAPNADIHALCQVGLNLADREGPKDEGKASQSREALLKVLKVAAASEGSDEYQTIGDLRASLEQGGVKLPEPSVDAVATNLKEGGKKVTLKLDGPAGRGQKDTRGGGGKFRERKGGGGFSRGVAGDKRTTKVLIGLNVCALGWLAILMFAPANGPAISPEDLYLKDTNFFNELSMSDDPLVHGKLEKEFKETKDPIRRELVFRSAMARSRRMGLMRAADVLRLTAHEKGFGNAEAIPFELSLGMAALDPMKPDQAKRDILSSAYSQAPQFVANLAAGLALDRHESSSYHDIFVRAAEDRLSLSQAAQKNDLTLMLLLPDVHDLFSEDIVSRSAEIPSDDLRLLLSEMTRQEHSGIATVAQIAMTRGISKEAGQIFLAELQRSAGVDSKVRAALVAGALGNFSEPDVEALSQWYAPGAARSLEAILITTQDPSMRKAAFEALRSKPLGDGYVSGVMEFIQATYGTESERYAPLVATLALREVVGPAAVKDGLGVVAEAPSGRKLAQRIMHKAPSSVIIVALPELHPLLEPADVTDLLQHEDKAVRLQALPYLSTANDILVLKLIQQSFEQEQDEEVKKAYQDYIPTIRERSGLL